MPICLIENSVQQACHLSSLGLHPITPATSTPQSALDWRGGGHSSKAILTHLLVTFSSIGTDGEGLEEP